MQSSPLQLTIDEMRNYIADQVATGFSEADDIVENAVEVFSVDHDPEVLEPIAEQLTEDAVAKHQAEQQQWPEVTDCDLLDRAFDELENAGIVARHNFTCCGT